MDYQKHKRKFRQFYPNKIRVKTAAVVASTVQRETTKNQPTTFTCNYVTLWNMDLDGTEVIDGVIPTNGDKILVANQSDKKQNGIYNYNDSGAWQRNNVIKPGAIITITGGAKQGTMWVVETATFTIGTDDISIVESALNRKQGDYNNFTSVAPAEDDLLLIEDESDNNKKKRVTLSALKTFFNFLSKAANQFTTFSTVTPDNDDVLLIEDDSDSFNKKKITIGDILGLLPDGLLLAEKTLYVSPNFPNDNQMFSTMSAALTYADNTGNTHLIKVYRAEYIENCEFGSHSLYAEKGVIIKPSNKTLPALSFDGGDMLGYADVQENGVGGTDYLVEITEDAKIEAISIYSDYGAINIKGNGTGPGRFVDIDVDVLGKVKHDTANEVFVNMDIEQLHELKVDGATGSTFNVTAKQLVKNAELKAGKIYLDVQHYNRLDTRIIEVDGADVIAKGRIEDFANATDSVSGSGYPIQIKSGNLRLVDMQAKNDLGGVVHGTGGDLKLGNSVLESGTTSGTLQPTIDTSTTYTVTYISSTGLNKAVAGTITENAAANRVESTSITI